MRIDAKTLSDKAAHDLLKGCVVPRPIAWVTTLGPGGVVNAAPYSCFTFVATRPPMVCFSVERRGAEKKDTLRNLERTGDFVVNVVPDSLAEAMNATSADYPPDVSELAEVGLTAAASDRVTSPRIAECPISLECRVSEVLELGASPGDPKRRKARLGTPGHSLVIAEVLVFHVRDELYRNGEIDQSLLRPVGRLSGNLYLRAADVFELARPWLENDRPAK